MAYNVNWYASLSDGTSRQEGKGEFTVIEGQPSPWLRLLAFCEQKGLVITSLSLRSKDLAWNLPSAGKHPKFGEFDKAQKPDSYRFYRKAGFEVNPDGSQKGESDRFSVIEADYAGHKLQLWVDHASLASWTLIA
jgi:hypothetical protein